MGWSFGVPYIERVTNLGLPRYDASDLFVAGLLSVGRDQQ